MSALLNLCCHGYVLTPILEACQRRRLFERLDATDFRRREWLISKLAANPGYFTVALLALESAGWLEKNTHDAYRLTIRAQGGFDDRDLSEFYAVEPRQLIQHSAIARLFAAKIESIFPDGRIHNPFPANPAEGAVILLLFLVLKELDNLDSFPDKLDQLDVRLARTVEGLFIRQHWLTVDKRKLTAAGRQLLQSNVWKAAASWRSLLAGMEELLFGDHAGVTGGEALPDIILGDSLHESCFSDLHREITGIFNQPLERQPTAVVHLGCGDGRLLKEVYDTVLERTLRGQNLERQPLRLVGVDSSQSVLEAMSRTLAGLEHHAVRADIGQPEKLDHALEQIGLGPGQPILHICCFADRLVQAGERELRDDALGVLAAGHPAGCLDNGGGLLDALTVLSGRQRLLRERAKSSGYASSLLVLEAHALPAQFACRLPDGTDNFYLDALYNFSHQRLIGAEAFIVLAARAGLFNEHPPKRYPEAADFCRATLHHLSRRDYIVRHAAETDLPRLDELEKLCWQHTQTPVSRIRARLQKYPQGQFVLEKEGRVLGVLYSQRIAHAHALEKHSAADVHELHEESGPVVQLLAVNVDPTAQNMRYGDQLLEFMLQRCSLIAGVRQVVGVTLCKNFKASGSLSFEQYIQQQGGGQDPVLAFHQSHGAAIVKALPDYRPQDLANLGHGVLVAYDILRRELRIPAGAADDSERKPVPRRQQLGRFLQETVEQLLGERKDAFAPGRPLMEMGLDSADLLQLQQHIEEKFERKFGPGFFFEYNSVDKVVGFLAAVPALAATAPRQKSAAPKTAEKSHHKTAARAGGDHAQTVRAAAGIAVVGMSCKLPGGIETPERLWQLLAAGGSVIGSYPTARGEWPADRDRRGIDRGGFIERADLFDAAFFRISPTEAQVTDPQQRMLLELAWTCLEEAAVLPESLRGTNTGVFIGASNCDYSRLIQAAGLEAQAHYATGGSLAVLANRLSYFFDLCGPSLLIDTACSASLVAMHTAIQSLHSGECAAALVGGVNLICHPDLSIAYHKAGMLAPDGRCKVFDAAADGYVRSEGAAMLLLKPLDKAVADGNRIHAVIRGSAINHGGLAGGLTVPNPRQQSELLTAAWKNAGVAPEDLSYIEAHGTGTSLGDPIEVQGLQTAYAQSKSGAKQTACGIGSVKSNLGHLESAAGITGVLKVILSMRHGELPASINFEALNPKISLEGTPFYIAHAHRQWDSLRPRLAGVSSFGSGGANAHVVIEEWQQEENSRTGEKPRLLVVSARNKERLMAYVRALTAWIDSSSAQASFTDFIYTFQTGRTAMEERLAVVASSFAELRERLSRWLETGAAEETVWQENAAQSFSKPSLLMQGEAGQRMLTAALAEKNLKQLAMLWISGFSVDFEALYDEEAPRRIAAPTYPFAGQRYWIEAKSRIEAPAAVSAHPMLGARIPSEHGAFFARSLKRLPAELLFTQGGFSCLSLGFILETFIAAGDEIFPAREIASINRLKYYPFHLEEGAAITYETRCYPQSGRLLAESVQILDGEKILIAEAELDYAEKSPHAKPGSAPQAADWISLQERGGGRLPVDTLKSIFPALLGADASAVVSIPRIQFHGSAASTRSMLVALDPSAISIFTETKQPLLSIFRAAIGQGL